MGMDVYAENGGKAGYFRASIWTWPGLWQAIIELCSDVLSEDEIVQGFHNEGNLITEAQAKVIGKRLHEALLAGYFKPAGQHEDGTLSIPHMGVSFSTEDEGDPLAKFAGAMEAYWDNPKENTKNMRCSPEVAAEFAEFCHESGGFRIK